MNNITSLYSDNYQKGGASKTDKLTNEEIEKLLDDYTEIDKIDALYKVPLGTHIRYFVKEKDGSQKFRYGGSLFDAKGLPDYVILSNGKSKWSVQLNTASLWRKMTVKEIKDDYEQYVKELETENELLESKVNKYKFKYEQAKEEIEHLKKMLHHK